MTKIKATLFKFVPSTEETVGEKVTWIDVLINALILAGLGFFGTISGLAITQIVVEPKVSMLAGLISAGLQFFISLSIQRGLRSKET